MSHLYNEIDGNAAQWLRNLMAAGEIPQEKIDGRPIQELTAEDFRGVTQFHTFAGIGGWPLALRLAGWPEDEEVWTGSCPCQPFSSAGKGKGIEDERHLWPVFRDRIAVHRPATIFGEQVASKAGRQWLVGVRTDLEALGYRVGRADLCAASVGAPHIRQRLYWVADLPSEQEHTEWGFAERGRNPMGRTLETVAERQASDDGACRRGAVGRIPDDQGFGLEERQNAGRGEDRAREEGHVEPRPDDDDDAGGLADDDEGLQDGRPRRPQQNGVAVSPWSDYRIVPCTDGKARRTGARVFPLAYGLPRGVGDSGAWRKGLARSASRSRIGILKGSGNAIVPMLAATFIRAYLDCR